MNLKFALNHNDKQIRTLDELKKHCDIDQLLKDYRDGKLRRWLEALRNLDNLVSAIDDISAEDDLGLAEELVRIIDIDRQILDLAYYNRGLAYDNLEEYQKEIADYNKAIELNPDYAYAYLCRRK